MFLAFFLASAFEDAPHALKLKRSLVGFPFLYSAKASSRLLQLCQGAKSEYVQLEAAKDILDRSGFKAPDKHQHLVGGDFKINIDLS